MSMHLRSGEFADLLDGGGSARARQHIDSCSRCQATLAELRRTAGEVREIEAPEPSPLFWDSELRRIQRSVAAERWSQKADPASRSGLTWLLALAGVVAIVAAVLFNSRPIAPEAGQTVAPASSAARMTIESAAPSVAVAPGEGSLDFVTELAEDVDWSASSSTPQTALVGSLEQEASQLDPAERRELRRLLEELAHQGA
jgi:anti-sigma factor RsiW